MRIGLIFLIIAIVLQAIVVMFAFGLANSSLTPGLQALAFLMFFASFLPV